MPTSLYWREKKTGALYAIRVDSGTVGPSPPKEVASAKLRQWALSREWSST